MTTQPATDQAQQLITAVEEALQPATSYRDDSPIPVVGPTPPVAQPGRPPMSAKAVDDTARMLGASVLIATTGGATTGILWASGLADPIVVALLAGAPTALILAISRLVSRTKAVIGDTHNHYSGNIQQTNTTITTHSTWLGKTTNQL
ncbi:hypothetical protein ABZ958_03370 [Streptomyces sp. NPDC046237]|uniref:hypothetical protein n=1 Tax=Streptomyces sp. NPDC046237 TaxID=3154914 RepID=UPI0033CD0150